MLLIDTDIASYAIKSQHGIALRLLQAEADGWGISAVTYHEISFGLSLEGVSNEAAQMAPRFLGSCKTFPFDQEAASAAALIRKQLRLKGLASGHCDVLIAGHAIALDATLVTNNYKHFENVPGLKLESWL